MKNLLAVFGLAVVALLLLGPHEAQATCTAQVVSQSGTHILYSGSCTDDNETVITTGDVSQYRECSLVSTAGAVDIVISLDGTTYTTAAGSMIDLGATDTAPVIVTAALRHYAFPLPGGVRRVRVIQNGATDAAAVLTCK